MPYAIRVSNNTGQMNFTALRKYWEQIGGGQIIVHKNELSHQVFDMIPPPDFRGEAETKEWADAMSQDLEGMGYEVEIIEIVQN